jgi:hypothetical protein
VRAGLRGLGLRGNHGGRCVPLSETLTAALPRLGRGRPSFISNLPCHPEVHGRMPDQDKRGLPARHARACVGPLAASRGVAGGAGCSAGSMVPASRASLHVGQPPSAPTTHNNAGCYQRGLAAQQPCTLQWGGRHLGCPHHSARGVCVCVMGSCGVACRGLLACLRAGGVVRLRGVYTAKRIPARGCPFDPHVHTHARTHARTHTPTHDWLQP